MFIPPKYLQHKISAKSEVSAVRLQLDHLIISEYIAGPHFADVQNVNMVYYPDRQSLLIAPLSDELFTTLHKTRRCLLKDKNLNGAKSLAIHEILIDNQLDRTDRALEYEMEPELGILKITL